MVGVIVDEGNVTRLGEIELKVVRAGAVTVVFVPTVVERNLPLPETGGDGVRRLPERGARHVGEFGEGTFRLPVAAGVGAEFGLEAADQCDAGRVGRVIGLGGGCARECGQ